MLKNDLELNGGARKKKQQAEKTALTLPPTTLPQPSLRTLPPREKSKAPAELDPAVKTEKAAKVKTSAARGGSSVSAAPASSAGASGGDLAFHMPGEDEELRQRYESALAELEELRGAAPRYDSRYDGQIRELYEQITSRGPFRYDSATDPLYQQYRQDYTAQGRMAMRDTMGQAAALTGGYGSSYAQSVGQQQYDAYLRRLADVLPETYGLALNAWEAQGKDLQRRYQAAAALEQSDYERYLDELGQYNRTLERARSDADAAYERKLASEERAYRRASDDYKRRIDSDERAYRRRKAKA